MQNGRKGGNEVKVTSLDAARKAAAQRKRSQADGRPSLGQRVVGVVMIALAAGMLVHWGRGLLSAASVAP